MWYESAPILNS